MTYHEHVTLGLVREIQSELREMRAEIKAIDATEDPRESGGGCAREHARCSKKIASVSARARASHERREHLRPPSSSSSA